MKILTYNFLYLKLCTCLSIELHKANLVGLEVQYYPGYPTLSSLPTAHGPGQIGPGGYPSHAPGIGGVLTPPVSKLQVPM